MTYMRNKSKSTDLFHSNNNHSLYFESYEIEKYIISKRHYFYKLMEQMYKKYLLRDYKNTKDYIKCPASILNQNYSVKANYLKAKQKYIESQRTNYNQAFNSYASTIKN